MIRLLEEPQIKRLSDSHKELIEQMHSEGFSSREIATSIGRSKSTINDYLKKVKAPKAIQQGRPPRILLIDLETAPSVGVAFQRFNINWTQDHILEEGGWLISTAWKWLGEKKVHGNLLTPQEAQECDDSRILLELRDVVNKADIVIAHNARKFDVAVLNTRLLKYRLGPLKKVKVVDTLQIAKKLKFNSNKLDSIAAFLGIGRKEAHDGISLWIDCMKGKQKALDHMLKYNKKDVNLLEEVYLRIRAFDDKAPNLAHYYGDDKVRCIVCGGTHVHNTGNLVHTTASSFLETQCEDCGHIGRRRRNIKSKEHRDSLLTNVVQ